MLEENKAIVRRFVEEVQNQHSVDAIDRIMAPHFVSHTGAPGFPTNIDGAIQVFTMLFNAFPDIHVTIHDQVAEGDKVVTYKTFQGTHQGEFMGIAPTGKRFEFDVIDIYSIDGGKITGHWAVVDQLGLMQQLGAIPPLG